MTEEQLDKIVAEYDWDYLLEELGLTKEDVFGILYESGMLSEDRLEELCPL